MLYENVWCIKSAGFCTEIHKVLQLLSTCIEPFPNVDPYINIAKGEIVNDDLNFATMFQTLEINIQLKQIFHSF